MSVFRSNYQVWKPLCCTPVSPPCQKLWIDHSQGQNYKSSWSYNNYYNSKTLFIDVILTCAWFVSFGSFGSFRLLSQSRLLGEENKSCRGHCAKVGCTWRMTCDKIIEDFTIRGALTAFGDGILPELWISNSQIYLTKSCKKFETYILSFIHCCNTAIVHIYLQLLFLTL